MNQELVSLTEMERRDSLRQYIETSVRIEISRKQLILKLQRKRNFKKTAYLEIATRTKFQENGFL